MILFTLFFVGLSILVLAGCGADPTPRLVDLVGPEAVEPKGPLPQPEEWTRASKIGLMVYSDATAQGAAPALSPEYLETLTRRTENFLKQRCAFQEVLNVPQPSQPGTFSQVLKIQGQHLQVPYHVVVVLSSREQASPEKIGEATMMTQMSGTVVENSAMAEVGVLRGSDLTIVLLAQGKGTEYLEQLDVPIGRNQPSAEEAREIMRAQAAQQALDRALESVATVCQKGKSERSCVTCSFRIAGRGQSPRFSDVS